MSYINKNIELVRLLLAEGNTAEARKLFELLCSAADLTESRTVLHDLGNDIQRAIFAQYEEAE